MYLYSYAVAGDPPCRLNGMIWKKPRAKVTWNISCVLYVHTTGCQKAYWNKIKPH